MSTASLSLQCCHHHHCWSNNMVPLGPGNDVKQRLFLKQIPKAFGDFPVNLTTLYSGFAGCRTSPKFLPIGVLSWILGISVAIRFVKNGGSGPLLMLATVSWNREHLLKKYIMQIKWYYPPPLLSQEKPSLKEVHMDLHTGTPKS